MKNSINTIEASEVKINKKRELPLIWILPICALLVTGWLIYKTVTDKGPVITINFPTADGLEVGKTKIKFLNVDIGQVTDININDDLKTVDVIAQMDKDSADYLTKNTLFWVVRPQIGIGGVSGLSTLLSGAYIAIDSHKGSKSHKFVGLTIPPLLKTAAEGKRYTLESSDIGSMREGTPIYFHGIAVGEVLGYELAPNGKNIRLNIFINTPYDQFIRKNTRFWIDSGIDLTTNANGVSFRTGPLLALLSGGIAFRAADEDTKEDIEAENATFPLFANYELSTQMVYHNTFKMVLYFKGSVRGLSIDAPVLLLGIPIGKVVDIKLIADVATEEIIIPVVIEVEPDRIHKSKNKLFTGKERTDMIKILIQKGLRAQLQTGNLLTGQLFVAMDFFPDSKIALHKNIDSDYSEFPTTPNSLDSITESAKAIMAKLEKLPLDKLVAQMDGTLASLQVTSKAATKTLNKATGTLGTVDTSLKTVDSSLKAADKTLNSATKVLNGFEPGSTTSYELDKLLQGLSQTAFSVKQLTDYLEQHPDSLIRGKNE